MHIHLIWVNMYPKLFVGIEPSNIYNSHRFFFLISLVYVLKRQSVVRGRRDRMVGRSTTTLVISAYHN
jgi:hypothetical protein